VAIALSQPLAYIKPIPNMDAIERFASREGGAAPEFDSMLREINRENFYEQRSAHAEGDRRMAGREHVFDL
jgi:hypothetical protein